MAEKTPAEILRDEKAKLYDAGVRFKQLVRQLQEECPHPKEDIIEGDMHRGSTYGGCGVHVSTSQPPFRVCRRCGYAEEGWGCGYWKITKDYSVPTLPREEAWKIVIGGILSQNDMVERGTK